MSSQIDAVILAGGMARRMGGDDKGLVELNGEAMIKHTIDRIKPQVKEILINANRNQTRYAEFGFKVISDEHTGFLGPLAGMITAMGQTDADYLLVVPCDCPLLPTDLVPRMLAAIKAEDAEIAVASDGEYEQPVVLLLKPSLRDSMKAFLEAGERKVDFWYAKHHFVVESFADQPNAFVNVNTPEQKQRLAMEITK
ncbi:MULTISPECIES: molybdenum cofactor guanylyltransferase MobA [Shewanella]|uniref:Molybdenum cofactor guanylyltransferase n=1 Tax=Shewanella vaxholmensis TaxID=3063535 RepID=A0ABU9UP07_9GAMM|nr:MULTISPECIES: molybdenum cofactor guanylyltransferase MobA [Shewanella]MCB2384088.1 molybdenum cofactor guanylyltransferase [Shewanella sp. SR1]MCS6191688.1 molybdenum cofactor guanylyltransferase [Shewanella baltica]MCS6232094.1 molybdenum cofactor guanylyltransferase [Shewanella baltica]MCS6239662.1 molybdenum cofactor guanylyltransferase [Shewanella baltica]MDT3297049.1 molybdenum cofactor guanylyltransferase MobA [Shewanella sp. SP2S2-6]